MGGVKRIIKCSVQKQIGCGDERLFSANVCLNVSVIKHKEKKHRNKKVLL